MLNGGNLFLNLPDEKQALLKRAKNLKKKIKKMGIGKRIWKPLLLQRYTQNDQMFLHKGDLFCKMSIIMQKLNYNF